MCTGDILLKTERYLKKLENSIANQLDPKEKDLFLKSSKAWSNYVNLTCQFDTESLGSIQGSVACSCHIELHLSRIKALENYEKCLQTKDCERPYLLYRDLSSEK